MRQEQNMTNGNREFAQNNLTYQRLKATISKAYPSGWFVGIAEEKVIAAAEDFSALVENLRSIGKDPRNVLVVQVGVDYPESVTIFQMPKHYPAFSG